MYMEEHVHSILAIRLPNKGHLSIKVKTTVLIPIIPVHFNLQIKNKGQKSLSQHVLYSEVPLYIILLAKQWVRSAMGVANLESTRVVSRRERNTEVHECLKVDRAMSAGQTVQGASELTLCGRGGERKRERGRGERKRERGRGERKRERGRGGEGRGRGRGGERKRERGRGSECE